MTVQDHILDEADDWQFRSKTKLIFYIFCPISFLSSKNVPARLKMNYFSLKSSKVVSYTRSTGPQVAGGFAPRVPLPPAAGDSTPRPPAKIYGSTPAGMNASDSSGSLLSLDHAFLPRNWLAILINVKLI